MERIQRFVAVAVTVVMMASLTTAQSPPPTPVKGPLPPNFMGGFAANMNNMMQNLQTNLQRMNQRISANTQRLAAQVRAQEEINRSRLEGLQPGTGRYFDDVNGRGYIYRELNGGYRSYTFGSGGPATGNGFIFQTGPQGTFQRSW